MEQIQTIQCPKCGTITDCKENCSNCDSMLPRVAAVLCNGEDDVNTSLKYLGFGDNAYVSTSLLEVVEKTKTQSKKHNTLITSYTTIEDISGVSIKLYATPDIPVSVAIDYDMGDSVAEQCFERIQSSKIGKLFRIKQKENYMHCITIIIDKTCRSYKTPIYIMLDTKKMIGISVADYIMEIWDYIILVNRSDYALYEQASDNDVLCDLLIWILGNDVCLAIPYTGSKGDLRAELEDFLDSQYFMNDEYV